MYTTAEAVYSLCKLITEVELPGPEVEGFITKAQARIDARLRKHYRVPLNEPVPAIIASIAADMAAAMVLDKVYSDRQPNQTTLSDVYRKRAEADLDRVIEEGLLDGLPGVVKIEPPAPAVRPALATTTPKKSPLEEALARW